MSEDRDGTASTAGERSESTRTARERSEPTRTAGERSEPTRTATVRTTHAEAAVVAAALAPDDTDSMTVAVDGDTIEARIERPTTGGLRSTVDDYVVNLRVADRVTASTETVRKRTTNTNADDTTDTNT